MADDRPILSTDPPIMRPPAVEPGLVLVQARLVDALVGGAELCGTMDDLAAKLGVKPHDLAAAAEELEAVGWLAVTLDADGTVTLRWADDAR